MGGGWDCMGGIICGGAKGGGGGDRKYIAAVGYMTQNSCNRKTTNTIWQEIFMVFIFAFTSMP